LYLLLKIDRWGIGAYDDVSENTEPQIGIHSMPELRPVDLEAKPLVETYWHQHPPQVSELTFTNLFVWRHSRPVFFAEVEGSLVFLVNGNGSPHDPNVVFGHPLGGVSPAKVAKALDMEIVGFVRIPGSTASVLRNAGLDVEEDRDNADYVYRVEDLAELAGRRFHKKRNLVKQCLEAYACKYEPIAPELVTECSAMQDRWCQARRCGRNPGLCNEYLAIRESFDHWKSLQLVGGAIRIDGKIQAFALGETLRSGTAVCHFEKAMPEFQGLGQLINKWYAQYALKGFEFENREQDLGIPGLQQAKKSYHPDHMVDKFTAWFPSFGPHNLSVVEPHECAKHGSDEE
jgi:hypothetical protein